MLEVFRLGRRRRAKRCSRAGESGSKLPYLFRAPTENSPGARDLSRRNAGKADPRLEISRPRRQPIFLWTKVRAPFARPANTLNTYNIPMLAPFLLMTVTRQSPSKVNLLL